MLQVSKQDVCNSAILHSSAIINFHAYCYCKSSSSQR